MPAHERILYYDPSTHETETSDSKTILDLDPSKFESGEFQSLDIPPLCNTITVYIEWQRPANPGSDTAKWSSGSPTAKEPFKFALSRSRRIVNYSDLVATISLRRQQNNSWLQRHLPLQPYLFHKIIIGPFSKMIIAMKDESASAEDKPESSKDRSNS